MPDFAVCQVGGGASTPTKDNEANVPPLPFPPFPSPVLSPSLLHLGELWLGLPTFLKYLYLDQVC